MAAAMARGWAGAGIDALELIFSDKLPDRAAELAAELGGSTEADNAGLAVQADVLLLAVKPAVLEEAAGEIAASGTPVISILGATPLAKLEQALPESPLVRVIPNLGVAVRRGVLCYAVSDRVDGSLGARITGLLGELGTAIELDDGLIDAATAVMSCSPAYLARAGAALIESGAREGLDPELAKRLVLETMAGTAELLRERDPGAIAEAVASPGGSTEVGLEALEKAGFEQALADAVTASLERMRP